MIGIAILVLEYSKHKHDQVREFCTILTKINGVDEDYHCLSSLGRTLTVRANVQKFPSYQSCTWGIYLCFPQPNHKGLYT